MGRDYRSPQKQLLKLPIKADTRYDRDERAPVVAPDKQIPLDIE